MTTSSSSSNLARASALGLAQIILFGGSFFFIAVIADPVVSAMHWPRQWVVGSLSIALLVSGLPAPFVGRLIQRHGGRPVLAGGAALLAAGLILAAASTSLPVFVASWVIIGLGMAACLYDPLFSAMGQAYGGQARAMITQITLISGFATTVSWPASHVLIEAIGWRMTCLAYAGASVLIAIPIFLWAIPKGTPTPPPAASSARPPLQPQRAAGLFQLAACFTISSMIMTAVSVELLMVLQQRGISSGQAVMLSTLMGPAQFLARAFEGTVGKRAHPYWGMLMSATCVLIGLTLLAVAPGMAWLAIVLYGVGNGIRTIVRGTLPLAIYGPENFAGVMGRLARPPLIGQAATPWLAGLIAQTFGGAGVLAIMVGAAVINLALVLVSYPLTRSFARHNPA
jgi:MFS family permease